MHHTLVTLVVRNCQSYLVGPIHLVFSLKLQLVLSFLPFFKKNILPLYSIEYEFLNFSRMAEYRNERNDGEEAIFLMNSTEVSTFKDEIVIN